MTGDRFGLYYPEMRFDSDWLRLGARRSKAEVTSPSAAFYLAEVHSSLTPRRGVEALLNGFRRVSASELKHHDRPYLGGPCNTAPAQRRRRSAVLSPGKLAESKIEAARRCVPEQTPAAQLPVLHFREPDDGQLASS
jgi:hypothetical protein